MHLKFYGFNLVKIKFLAQLKLTVKVDWIKFKLLKQNNLRLLVKQTVQFLN